VQKFVQASLPDLDKEIIAGDNYSIDGTAAVELFGQQQPAVVTNISFINKIRGRGPLSEQACRLLLLVLLLLMFTGCVLQVSIYILGKIRVSWNTFLLCLRLCCYYHVYVYWLNGQNALFVKLPESFRPAVGLNTRGRKTALSFVLSRRCLDFQSEVPVYLFTPSKDALLLWLNGHTVDHFGGSTVWT
jgi:hypothetical protein